MYFKLPFSNLVNIHRFVVKTSNHQQFDYYDWTNHMEFILIIKWPSLI